MQELVANLEPTLPGRSTLHPHSFPLDTSWPHCHCVFEDGIVWLLADSVTGLQASCDPLSPYATLLILPLPLPLLSLAQPSHLLRVWSSYLFSLPPWLGRECQGPAKTLRLRSLFPGSFTEGQVGIKEEATSGWADVLVGNVRAKAPEEGWRSVTRLHWALAFGRKSTQGMHTALHERLGGAAAGRQSLLPASGGRWQVTKHPLLTPARPLWYTISLWWFFFVVQFSSRYGRP